MARVSPSEVQVSLAPPGSWLPPETRRAILERAMLLGIGAIKRRTGKGLDVEGKPFLPYSPRYAKLREESGRRSQPVTLLLQGAMLNGLAILANDGDRGLVGFTGTAPATSFSRRRKARKIKRLTDEQLDNAVSVRAYKPRPARSLKKSKGSTISNALKAKYLTDGNSKGRPPKPRRFVGLTDEERAAIVRDLNRFRSSLT